MANPQLICQVQQLGYAYEPQHPLLEGLDLNLYHKQFTGIIGPNGAGKSTLIRLLAGMLRGYKGQITLVEKQLHSYTRRELAHQLAYVPQHIELNFPFTVSEVVAMGRYAFRQGPLLSNEQQHSAIQDAIEAMDLQTLAGRSFTSLSGGEQQRTVIASALAQQAPLLLLDEPTTALDLRHQQLILQRLRQDARESGQSIVLVTHDINLAAQFCDRLILMHKGKIIADGTPEEVLQFSLLQEVYGVQVYIDVNPFTKSIYILPYRAQ